MIRLQKRLYEQATRDCSTVWLSVLTDKEGFDATDIARLQDEFNEMMEAINSGYCSMADRRDALKQEYNIVMI